MQEVLYSQLNYLTNILEDYAYVGVGREDGKTKGEFSPIFFREKNLELLKSSTFWLSETPEKISLGWDAALERICTYALFEHRKTRKQFLVFNTHFDHVGKISREQSVKLILKKAKELNPSMLPTLIIGDFNLTPEDSPIIMLQKFFEDILKDLKPKDPKYGTFNGFNTEKNAERRIDYIFQRGFIVKESNHLWIKTPKGLWASDHHPVYLVCSFQ